MDNGLNCQDQVQVLLENKDLSGLSQVFTEVDWLKYEEALAQWLDLLLCFEEEHLFSAHLDSIGVLASYRIETLELMYEILLRLQHPRRSEIAQFLGLESSKTEVYAARDYPSEFLASFLERFRGRESVYALQFHDGKKTGYRPIHQSLDSNLIERHLNGVMSLGVYVLQRDQRVSFCALDFDIRRAVLNTGVEEISSLVRDLLPEVLDALKLVREAGFDPLLEFSGYKGFHIWMFFHEPVPANMVRQYIKTRIQPSLRLSSRFQYEVFPKQDKVKDGGLGNLIKLPLGRHLASGRFSYLLDDSGQRVDDPVAYLPKIRPLLRAEFIEVCGLGEVSYSPAIEPAKYNIVPPTLPEEIRFKEPEDDHTLIRLFSGCDSLRTLRKKILLHSIASSQEQHVLIYVLAPLGESGVLEIHRILSKTMTYDPDEVNRKIKAVPPHLISCPKIRQRIGEICEHSDCNCQFPLEDGCYPSPLIHVGKTPHSSGKLTGRNTQGVMLAAQGTGIDRWVNEHLQLSKKLTLLQERLLDLKTLISAEFEKNGGDVIETSVGRYSLSDGDEFSVSMEGEPEIDQEF
jgi:hypothetical protein